MYPINNASPQRVAIGAVVQISDGAVQTSGVSVKVLPQGTTASAGGGTIAYEEGIVHYLPTQAETNYASFILIAYKTGCIPATVTVVTSASATAGYAGLDWGVVANKTTTNALTGTTIATTQKVDVETIKTQAVTAAAGVTFPTNIASPTNITAGTITTTTNLTNAPTAGDFTATMKTSIGTAVAASAVASVTGNVGGNVTGSVGSVTGLTNATIADQVWDEALAGHVAGGSTGEALGAAGGAGDPWITALPGAYSAGSAGQIVGDYINATISSRATQTSVDTIDDLLDTEVAAIKSDTAAILIDTAEIGAAGAGLTALATQASVNTIDDFLDTEVAAIKAKTDLIPAAPAAVGDIPTATQNADALLNRDMSAVSDTNARSPLNALRFLRNKWDIAGTALTVKKEDDSTTAWTATVTAAPGADPISGNDPA